MKVVEIADPEERSRICQTILRSVPDWFGIEDAIREYVEGVAELTTFVVRTAEARDAGFIAVKQHTERAAEVWVMAVVPELHRRGAGRQLIAAAEQYAAARGIDFLQVKTLGPSRPSEHYARTRAFYEAVGFVPLEELHGLWGEQNPCLLLVKQLA